MMTATSERKRALLYCRVSTEEQGEEGYSFPTQEARGRAFATEQAWTITGVVRESLSGKVFERPELQRALELARRGEIDVLLVYAGDRLTRDPDHAMVILGTLRMAGVEIVSVTQPELSGRSVVTDMLWMFTGHKANDEWAAIRERTQRGRRARIDSGKPLVSPRPPFGYVFNAAKTAYDLDPDAEPIVRMVFEWAIAGVTLRGIVERLRERGIPSPTGQPRWQATTVRQMLLRPVYAGQAVAFATRHERIAGGKYKRRDATADEIVVLPGVAPPIVTADELAEVANRLGRNKAGATRNNRHPEATLLRAGHVSCGHCGWSMGVKNPPPSAPGRSPVYQCNARSMGPHDCPQPRIAATLVDSVVWDVARTILLDPEVIRRVVDARRDGDDAATGREAEQARAAVDRIAAKQKNLARRVADLDDDAVAEPLYAELKELAERKAAATATRDRLAARLADAESERAGLRPLEAWCRRVAVNVDRLTYDDKRDALAALGIALRVYRTDATDDAGDALPRWEIVVSPAPVGSPIVYGRTSPTTPASPSSGTKRRCGPPSPPPPPT